MTPKNWPKEFTYSTQSHLKDCDLFTLKLFLRCCFGQLKDPDVVSPLIAQGKVHPHLSLALLKNPHPLAGQRGVFAKAPIEKDAILGEFVGEISLSKTPKDLSTYACCLCLGDQFLVIDPKTFANELAFVNDYRGLAKEPNVGVIWIPHDGSFHFGFKTICSIPAGQELLIDYGDAYWHIDQPRRPPSCTQ